MSNGLEQTEETRKTPARTLKKQRAGRRDHDASRPFAPT